MQDNKSHLGTAPVGKLLFRLAIPTLVAKEEERETPECLQWKIL